MHENLHFRMHFLGADSNMFFSISDEIVDQNQIMVLVVVMVREYEKPSAGVSSKISHRPLLLICVHCRCFSSRNASSAVDFAHAPTQIPSCTRNLALANANNARQGAVCRLASGWLRECCSRLYSCCDCALLGSARRTNSNRLR